MAPFGRFFLAMLGLAAVVGIVLTGAYFSGEGRHGADLSRSKVSQHGLFQVSLVPEPGKLSRDKLHSWELTLKTAAGAPVEYAAIDISGGRPQQDRGLPTSPQATDYLGKGRYRIEGVKFTASGLWQLRLAISAAPGTDTVVFNVVL